MPAREGVRSVSCQTFGTTDTGVGVFVRGKARSGGSAMRQQPRGGKAEAEGAPAPDARAPNRIDASHLLIMRTASPAVRPSVVCLVVWLCGCSAFVWFCKPPRKCNGRGFAFFRVGAEYFLFRIA